MSDIRLLQPYEVPLLVPQAREFYKEGALIGQLNEKHFVSELSGRIEKDTGFVLVSGAPFRGAIGGMFFSDLATGEFGCAEFFWYVAASERGTLGIRLWDAFERHAIGKGNGTVNLIMMHLNTPRMEAFESLYARRGYALREKIHVKQVRA